MLILQYGVVLYSSKQPFFHGSRLVPTKCVVPPTRVRKGHNAISWTAHKPFARFVEGI